jgi:hypothetical protein
MFIYKVDLSKFNKANINTIPEGAVYFGDASSNTYGQTIAVDEYGYIYVHGSSSSPAFGGHHSNSRFSWLHVKTHWELTYELQYNQNLGTAGVTYSDPSPGYLGKRFIRPKKFQNAHGINSFAVLLYDNTVSSS